MKKTIFLVDDSATNLTNAQRILEGKYDVITLESAKQMFDELERQVPNLILLDVEMPEMSGVEAIAKLEESEEWMDIPVIFFTAHTKEEYISQCLETGACDIIIKPYDADKLLDIVALHIA